jgi:nucleoside-diphosphate-sugar epimerase
MKIVLTGCNGSIGRVCGEHLAAAGHHVFGVDASARTDRPHPVTVADLRDPFAIHRVLDAAASTAGADQADAIVHMANHRNSDAGPAEMVLRENLAINTSVFIAAAERGINRLVFTSSVQAVLGGVEREFRGADPTLPPSLPVNEALEPRPTNSYGLSKLLTERMLDELCRMHERLSAVSLRLPFVMPEKSFEMNLERRAPSEQLWGATEAFMYVHVADAAEAIRLACESTTLSGHEAAWIVAPDPRPPDPIEDLV